MRFTDKKIFFHWLVCGILVFDLSVAAASDGAAFKPLATTANSFSFQFKPASWRLDTLQISNTSFLKIQFDEARLEGEPGQPMLAAATVVIGLPPTGDVSVAVMDSRYRELDAMQLAPYPRFQNPATAPTKIYEIDSAGYSQDAWLPRELVQIQAIGYFRAQRVATLRLNPVQYLARQNKIRLYDLIQIQIQFTAVPPAPTFKINPVESNARFYDALLLNAPQAREWRQVPRMKMAKNLMRTQSSKFYKIPITKEGLYQVTGEFLKSKGIDISTIDPTTLKIFNNGGRELPTGLLVARPDSLIENAIEVSDGGDKKFNENDYFLFYGKGVDGWQYDGNAKIFSHYSHHFFKENIYWLTWGDGVAGKRITTRLSYPIGTGQVVPTHSAVYAREDEVSNIFHSGSNWYGDYFSTSNATHTYKLYLAGAKTDAEARFSFRCLGKSGSTISTHQFEITVNNKKLGQFAFTVSYDSQTQYDYTLKARGFLLDGVNELQLKFQTNSSMAEGYLDWFEIQYPATFKPVDNELIFNGSLLSSLAQYSISGLGENSVWIYDISNYADVVRIGNAQIATNILTLVDSCGTLTPLRYLALNSKALRTPTTLVEDQPSTLRASRNGAHYVIIAHNSFLDAANRLANHRQTHDQFNTLVVDIQDIYDEFAWGLSDPVAIRDFLKTAYQTWSIQPELVLLFGDGNYDYKNNAGTSLPNFIPPYETNELNEINSRAMDEWYTYVSGQDNYGDLAIGRFPAQNAQDARILVDKVIAYDADPQFGIWKNTITMLADDEFVSDGKVEGWNIVHTVDAEDLAENYVPPTFDVKKIYLMEYPAVRSASISGIRKPLAGEDFINQVNRGTLVVNFIGHGNETVLTHERILTLSEALERMDNGARQSFWIAATCAWGRYDMPNSQAMSEQILLLEGRGAIGLLTASREAYANENVRLNQLFNRNIFPRQGTTFQSGVTTRIGEALMLAKNAGPSSPNDQKYHILGDPALKLAVPRYRMAIKSIEPNRFQALSRIKVKGNIYQDATPATDFQGKIYLTAFDSKKIKTYRLETGAAVQYYLSGGAIFRGTAAVTGGGFEMEFVVPKDITYGGYLGRISSYFWNDQIDGAGKTDSLTVGGTATGLVDLEGPRIEIQFKGVNIGEGALVGPKPILKVILTDSLSGINITGEIGHKIMLTVDENGDQRRDITEFFVFDQGSYLKGTLEYPLTSFLGSSSEGFQSEAGLTPGEHTVAIKAWDNFNNSSQRSIRFMVLPEGEFKLSQLLNYPNPFSKTTNFTFFISEAATIKIQIYTVAGRLIRSLNEVATAGFNHQYQWDGEDEDGNPVANGVYLYRISANTLERTPVKHTEEIGRIIVMR